MRLDKRICVIACDDNTDGNAYMTDFKYVNSLTRGYEEALHFLHTHDHICIIRNSELKTCKALSFKELAPYSLIIETGAKTTVI